MDFNVFTPKKKPTHKKNSIEALNDMDKQTANQVIEEFFGGKHSSSKSIEQANFSDLRKEFTIFKQETHKQEHVVPQEIQQLSEEIKREIEALKRANQAIVSEAQEIEKENMKTHSAKSGVYQARFMETLLSLIKNLRAKVGEARTWMAAMHSKKAKRGSLFMARTKKKGNEYAMSPELSNSRSVM